MRFSQQNPMSSWISLWLAILTSLSTTAHATKTNSPASRTISTNIATHTVQVGPKTNPHAYVPNSIFANVGDVILFEFYPTNHSVVKADYLAPCVPASEGLFYSGPFNSFKEQDGQLVGLPPTWSVVVNDTKPTFFYCTAIGSCLQNGMVGVINPDASHTFEAQYAKALTYPYMLVPGQSAPAEGSTTTSPNPSSSSSGAGLSPGAIAGIAVSGAVFVGVLVLLFFVLGRNRVYSQWMSSQDGRNERTARWALGTPATETGATETGTVTGHITGHGGEPWSRVSELHSDGVKGPTSNVTSAASMGIGSHESGYGIASFVEGSASGGSALSPYQATVHGYENGYGYGYGQVQGQGQGQRHCSWDGVQGSRMNRGPVELEAHGVGYRGSEKGVERDCR